MVWNDVFYRIKTSDEILDPLRVFVSDKELVKHLHQGDRRRSVQRADHRGAAQPRRSGPLRISGALLHQADARQRAVHPAQAGRATRSRAHQELVPIQLLPGRPRTELQDAQTQGDRGAAGIRQHGPLGLSLLLRQRSAETHPGGHGSPHTSHAQALRPGLERAGFLHPLSAVEQGPSQARYAARNVAGRPCPERAVLIHPDRPVQRQSTGYRGRDHQRAAPMRAVSSTRFRRRKPPRRCCSADLVAADRGLVFMGWATI